MIKNTYVSAVILVFGIALSAPVLARDDSAARVSGPALQEISKDKLPPEARDTLQRIERGGPFPYDRDGIVFGNFERRLPQKERGYYQEYTVKTPGVKHRGARRIVAGGCSFGTKRSKDASPPHVPCARGERYYTDDHYKSFRQVTP